eukprot:13837080-Alexandrium_andersonii.AAC.1
MLRKFEARGAKQGASVLDSTSRRPPGTREACGQDRRAPGERSLIARSGASASAWAMAQHALN